MDMKYDIFLHPDGKMWAIGQNGKKWVTLWGVTQELNTNAQIYKFTHSGKSKSTSSREFDKKISEKRAKGYRRMSNTFYEDKTMTSIHGGIVLAPEGVARNVATEPPAEIPDPRATERAAEDAQKRSFEQANIVNLEKISTIEIAI
jgi:predicted DNA-binding WGR domain protein